jgi:hypothetical protein
MNSHVHRYSYLLSFICNVITEHSSSVGCDACISIMHSFTLKGSIAAAQLRSNDNDTIDAEFYRLIDVLRRCCRRRMIRQISRLMSTIVATYESVNIAINVYATVRTLRCLNHDDDTAEIDFFKLCRYALIRNFVLTVRNFFRAINSKSSRHNVLELVTSKTWK